MLKRFLLTASVLLLAACSDPNVYTVSSNIDGVYIDSTDGAKVYRIVFWVADSTGTIFINCNLSSEEYNARRRRVHVLKNGNAIIRDCERLQQITRSDS